MSDLERVKYEASNHMDSIHRLFKPEVRLTLIARTPGNDDTDFMLTDDDLSEVARLIERRKEA